MRKAIGLNVAVLVITMVLTSGTAFAGNMTPGNGARSGPHWNINIIGHPKGIGGDYSSGHSVMIPLRNTRETAPLICADLQDVNGVRIEPTTSVSYNYEPTNAKIYFVLGDHFEILDRDATDDDRAKIMVPVGTTETGGTVVKFAVYIRVLGKPNQCMKINTYFVDETEPLNTVWVQTGTVSVYRTKGKSTFATANELFTICEYNPETLECSNVLNAFDNAYQNYYWLWDILNNGTRLLQMRLYPI